MRLLEELIKRFKEDNMKMDKLLRLGDEVLVEGRDLRVKYTVIALATPGVITLDREGFPGRIQISEKVIKKVIRIIV